MMDTSFYLPAKWPEHGAGKPANVSAITTLIKGGVSTGGYSEFNLAAHVDDDPVAVQKNREKLVDDLQLPAEPLWLDQVHSNIVYRADEHSIQQSGINPVQADASVTRKKGVVCVVLTADCLPVFFCNSEGSEVAVAHAGWRGLHDGILSNTLATMSSRARDVHASLGPAIGPQTFEVGTDVYDAFVSKGQVNRSAFVATDEDHYLCDIYRLAHIELMAAGVASISGGEYCTYSESQRFYSYRRQQDTGRMASLIWFE